MGKITIRAASANNLKNVSADIEFGRFTALAGPSGSGKSSLALDVLHAAALGRKVEASVGGLPELTVAITQKIASPSARLAELAAKTRALPQHCLVIADEPCAGLTAAEASAVAARLSALAAQGHAVVAVDHRLELLAEADRVLAFGPGAGADGGQIVGDTSGAAYVKTLRLPEVQRVPNAGKHKLSAGFKDFQSISGYEFSFPLHQICAITGPMGSGKSTVLAAALAVCDKSVGAGERRRGLAWQKGKEHIRRPHFVSSEPVAARNPRSTVATYFGAQAFAKNLPQALTVAEALAHPDASRLLTRRLAWLDKVGLAYLRLSQPAHTLSGGECQRVKLAKMLTKKLGDRSVYIFDNPCRGLGLANIDRIMMAFDSLVKHNNTVLIAENDPTALLYADSQQAPPAKR